MPRPPKYKAPQVKQKRSGIREDIGPAKVKRKGKVNRLKTDRGEDKMLFSRGGRTR